MFIETSNPKTRRRSAGRYATWKVLIKLVPPRRTTEGPVELAIYKHFTPTEWRRALLT